VENLAIPASEGECTHTANRDQGIGLLLEKQWIETMEQLLCVPQRYREATLRLKESVRRQPDGNPDGTCVRCTQWIVPLPCFYSKSSGLRRRSNYSAYRRDIVRRPCVQCTQRFVSSPLLDAANSYSIVVPHSNQSHLKLA
jgi:hypothetical protein